MLNEQQVIDALKPIEDPELHLGIVDLGLIYTVTINPSPEGQDIKVRMTFTTPFCPYGPALRSQVQQALMKLPDVKGAQVDVVFTPPWDPMTMASEDCKIALGIGWEEESPESGESPESER